MAMRRVSGMSRTLWWVANGFAAAPPAIDCSTGVSIWVTAPEEGGGVAHLLLAIVIRPLTTHPFRDGATRRGGLRKYRSTIIPPHNNYTAQ